MGGGATYIASLSNFSMLYNLSCATVATEFLKDFYPQPGFVKYTLLGLVFAGAASGMLFMGYLGDVIGVRKAMLFAQLLTIIGSLGCAVLPWGADLDVL